MKKNTASQKIGAQMVSASDGSAFTGTVTVYVCGDAGTQAIGSVGSGICTHEGNGYHTYAPSQAETNYDLIAFTFIGTGAIPATVQLYTQMDANVLSVAGTAQTANDMSGDIDTLLTRVVGTLATGTHNPQTGDAYAVVNSGTFGNSAIKTQLADIHDTDLPAVKTDTAAILADTGTDGVVVPQAQADKVWGTTARTLTAGTNIVLAKGTGVTGLNDLAAADVRTAVGLATANLDTQLAALPTDADVNAACDTAVVDGALATAANLALVKSDTAAILADTGTDGVVVAAASKTGYAVGTGGIVAGSFASGALDAAALNADAVDELWDEQIGDSTITARQALKVFLAALAGKLTGAATATITIRNTADTVNVIVATVDADGNRSAVTLTV